MKRFNTLVKSMKALLFAGIVDWLDVRIRRKIEVQRQLMNAINFLKVIERDEVYRNQTVQAEDLRGSIDILKEKMREIESEMNELLSLRERLS